LLIGNFLSKQVGTRSVCEDLSQRLESIGYPVTKTSDKSQRIPRLFDMVTTILSRRKEYDLAYLEMYSGLAFVWVEICAWLLSFLRKRFVLTLHGGGLPGFAQKHPLRVSRVLSLASTVVTPSLYLKESLARFCADIHYLPNAIDLGQYNFHVRDHPAPKLIWLRAFHSIYHPEMAILALSEMLKHVPDATLTMLGPDKLDGSLERVMTLVNTMNLQQQVTIRGHVQKSMVPRELEQADIFINTTSLESFGVSILEAAACGLPVVTTCVGELPYLWQNDRDALLVQKDDVQGMESAIRRLLTERGLAKRISANARHKAEQFDWSVVLPQWETLLQATGRCDVKAG
jgi:glycosyltransferase involved in cell wall biosynthesis